jgi:hypothetical protein
MNPELLTLRRLTAGIIYPPLAIQTVDLNRLYAMITERYPYQTLQHLPDGIRMANPDHDCFVQQTRTQVNEIVMYFQASKEKSLDIFRIVRDKLNIRQFMTFGVKLVAFLPMPEKMNAAEFLESKVISIRPEQWEILGPGRKGTGLRMVIQQEGTHELKIEPFFSDLTQLYVELDVQYTEPFSDLDMIERRMDRAYEYVFGNMKDFLASLKS